MKATKLNLKDETLYSNINFGQITKMYTLDQGDGGSMLFLETVFDTTLVIGFDGCSFHRATLEETLEAYLDSDCDWPGHSEEFIGIA